MPDEENNVKMIETESAKKTGEPAGDVKGKRLTGGEEVRKLAEDYEYKPPKNLKPPSPEESATQQTDHQETKQE